MKQEKKEMLLLEFQELSTSMRVFMGFRLTILGFSITIIGIIFTHLIGSDFYQKLAFEICLLFIVFALIKTMSSITRHLIIYGLRLKEIEKKFISKGFWSKWGGYLKINPQDSKTKTISVIVTIINLILLIFILVTNAVIYFNTKDKNQQLILVIFTTVVTAGFIYNFIQNNRHLNPNNHWKDIERTWDEINKEQDKEKTQP